MRTCVTSLTQGPEPSHCSRMGLISSCKHCLPLSSNGSRNVLVTAPAAATEWKVKMFCLAGRGFGLAPTTSLRTVQPLFVDVMLPYSVIRGETFMLKATVFSYLQQCIQVCACATGNTAWDRPTVPSSFRVCCAKTSPLSCPVAHLHLSFPQIHVALAKSPDYQVEPCRTCRDRECLCAEESKTFTWNVTAVQLGTAAKMGAVMGNPESEVRGSGRSREAGRALPPLDPEVCS